MSPLCVQTRWNFCRTTSQNIHLTLFSSSSRILTSNRVNTKPESFPPLCWPNTHTQCALGVSYTPSLMYMICISGWSHIWRLSLCFKAWMSRPWEQKVKVRFWMLFTTVQKKERKSSGTRVGSGWLVSDGQSQPEIRIIYIKCIKLIRVPCNHEDSIFNNHPFVHLQPTPPQPQTSTQTP